MTGFLKTLARRVLDPQAAVRPRTEPPFAATASSFRFEESHAVVVPAMAGGGYVDAGGPGAAHEAHRDPEALDTTSGASAATVPPLPRAEPAAVPPPIAETPEGGRSARAAAARPRQYEPLVPPSPRHAGQQAVRRESLRVTVQAAARRARPPGRVARERERPAVDRNGPASGGAHDEAPEVNVTIGRVELTAVAASPAPARVRASGRKPMSLEEYLERRAREKQ